MFKRLLMIWALTLFLIGVSAGMAYAAAQQTIRLTANYPQTQMAEDAAVALNSGIQASAVVSSEKTDPTVSLAPFVVIYNADRKVIASSGKINGKDPVPPAGVFDYVAQYGEDRVTWRPLPGVRIAIVMTSYSGGFVMAGRSLRDIESSMTAVRKLIGALWLCSSAVVSMVFLGVWLEYRRRRHIEADMQHTRID